MSFQQTELQQDFRKLQEPSGAKDIQVWLIAYLSQLLDIKPTTVDIECSFDSYGLDSSAAFGLTGDLEDWLDCELDPALTYDYPTIEQLLHYLAQTLATA